MTTGRAYLAGPASSGTVTAPVRVTTAPGHD